MLNALYFNLIYDIYAVRILIWIFTNREHCDFIWISRALSHLFPEIISKYRYIFMRKGARIVVKCAIYVNATVMRLAFDLQYTNNIRVLGNCNALRGVIHTKCKNIESSASARHVIVSFSAFRRSRSSEPHDGVPQGSTERSSDPWRAATCVALNQRLHRRRAKFRWVRTKYLRFRVAVPGRG